MKKHVYVYVYITTQKGSKTECLIIELFDKNSLKTIMSVYFLF